MKSYKSNPFNRQVNCLSCGVKTTSSTSFCTECQKVKVKGVKNKVDSKEVHCCIACGRDTVSPSEICRVCLGNGRNNNRENMDRRIFNFGGEPLQNLTTIHEDDYGEDAFPPDYEL